MARYVQWSVFYSKIERLKKEKLGKVTIKTKITSNFIVCATLS